jgi:predicted amidohydrolase YtcJ
MCLRCSGLRYTRSSERGCVPINAPVRHEHDGPADVILRGGCIVQSCSEDGFAEALAIRKGRVQAVGPIAEVMNRKGRITRLIDLDGRAIVPGFVAMNFVKDRRDGVTWKEVDVDQHLHGRQLAAAVRSMLARPVSDELAFVKLRTFCSRDRAREVAAAFSDAIAGPLVLSTSPEQVKYANAAAFKLAGARFGATHRVIDHGIHEVGDFALFLNELSDCFTLSDSEISTALIGALSRASRLGYTTVRDRQLGSLFGVKERSLLSGIVDERHLVRLRALAGSKLQEELDFNEICKGDADAMIGVDGVALDLSTFLPRTVEGETVEPFGSHLKRGFWPIIAAMHERDWQIELDAQSPEQVDWAIDFFSEVFRQRPDAARRNLLRSRCPLTVRQSTSLAGLGIYLTLNQECVDLNANARAPTAQSQTPLQFLKVRAECRPDGQKPREALLSALADLTIGAAWQCRCDHVAGTLEVGKSADIVILGASPFDVGISEIAAISIEQVWLQGIPVTTGV